MSNTFLIADLHFGQATCMNWLNADGSRMRPFESVFEMDETIIHNWNEVVKPIDKVYVLGDVAMKKAYIKQMERCNGKKVLIKGNHDIFKLEEYTPYFYDIRATHKLDNFILTHIPIHTDSITRWAHGNAHGHLHAGTVKLQSGDVDQRYICVSLEQTSFTPIALETMKKLVRDRAGY